MEKSNPGTLLELLEQFCVEIPIVQRDYAQGREGTKDIIDGLLSDIKAAVTGGASVDLNFIYGKEDKKEDGRLLFQPVDGQQRLTTLFLLHLYAFRDDNSKTSLFEKFTYETRVSSREFLAKLVEHRELLSCPKPSDIQYEAWFHSNWKYDPTVSSILNVLDKIGYRFRDISNLAEILADPGKKPIKFNFISMDDMGMEDSLYIKLNARGRELTPFEKFKADLVGLVKNMGGLPFSEAEFEQALDGAWTDYFWKLDSKRFDELFKKFFDLSFERICESGEKFKKVYASLAVKEVYYTLNFIAEINSQNSKITESIKEILGSKNVNLSKRILFNSISAVMGKSLGKINSAALEDWHRIIKNLTDNTNPDKDSYNNARDSIDKLAEHYIDITKFFAEAEDIDIKDIKGFSPDQVEEERVKAKLIIKSDIYHEKILDAETNKYFSGQLRSALYLAGLTLSDIDSQTDLKFTRFLEYWRKITLLFEDKEPKDGNLLRSTLLAYGDYLRDQSGGYRTFYIDNPSNDPESMKMLFSNGDERVKQMLDSIQGTTYDEISKEMLGTVNSVLNQILETDWRHWVIKYPNDILGYLLKGHMRIRSFGTKLLLVSKYASSSSCRELFTFALYLELQNPVQNLDITYKENRGMYADYFVEIDNTVEKFKINHSSGKFILCDSSGKLGEEYDVSSMIKLLKQKNII
jgi:hypothetical protein